MSKQKKVKLKDIAEAANVSTALVSYVLNGRHTERIKKETADKIKATAKRLNYRPNHFGKGLRTQKSQTIGLILADLANPFSAQIARIIENELSKKGYMLLIGSTDENNDKLNNLIDTFLKRQADGLIILPAEGSENVLEQLQQDVTPYVLLDRYFPTMPFPYVINDNHYGAYALVKHLIKKGKKKIGFITLDTSLLHLTERKRGFIDACLEEGIGVDNMIHKIGLPHLHTQVFQALDDLTNNNSDLDALLFSTNTLALEGMKYLIKRGLDTNNKIELATYDETEFYDIFPIPVTCYRQPLEEMGKKAVEFLLSKINGISTPTIQEVIKGRIISSEVSSLNLG